MSNFYGATSLIGGASGALDAIDGAALADLDGAVVISNDKTYLMRLDVDNAGAESFPLIISPDANPGDKRWVLNGLICEDIGIRIAIPGNFMSAYMIHTKLDIVGSTMCFLRLGTDTIGSAVTALWLHPYDCGDGGWMIGTNNDGKLRLGYNAGSGGDEGAAVTAVKDGVMGITVLQNNKVGVNDVAPGSQFDVNGDINTTDVYKVDDIQIVGNRVIDGRCDDTINSGDVTTDGVIDALRDAMITHGLIAAA